MLGNTFTVIIISIVLLLADTYVISGIRGAFPKWKFIQQKSFANLVYALSAALIIGLVLSVYVKLNVGVRAAILLLFFLQFIVKVTFILFVFADDIRRFVKSIFKKKEKQKPVESNKPELPAIPRSEFLMKAGLLAGAVPLAAMGYSALSSVYDYRVLRRRLYLPNLPKKFDGMLLGQISDIHSGSFYNKKAVLGGVETLLKEKPDLIFFTGDLVNDMTSEMRDYQDIFSKVKAPLGVYSTLGNHDYGDYAWWPDAAAKKKNLDDLIATHKNMGWDLLMNTHRRLKVDGEEIGILGIENWGELSRFPKYGRMDLAVKDTDDLPVKLLLSHDPSHWRAEVLKKYPQIDMMFSGHTHGMQFGVQTESFQWSPIKYVYKEWAGFYNEGNQQLYVNVGYGFIGYTGRIGILPEITIFELKAGNRPVES
ncbi:metallophosphoesterase [Mucilaginibacter limnophilus]|uniref:Metallophosphoesterase n=1 Tax=Mucilaginibacter limnophilus TaxID=1932778 RepID=A0A3S2UMT6_9SPHI|nr:metallophosphoesterase [Mucilaginibacter limnophilus]RVU01563.1 metallophosphoesterase [Mucilaginibacter limnophilus]